MPSRAHMACSRFPQEGFTPSDEVGPAQEKLISRLQLQNGSAGRKLHREVRRLTGGFQPRLRWGELVSLWNVSCECSRRRDLASKPQWAAGLSPCRDGAVGKRKNHHEYEKGNNESWSCRISVAISGSATVRRVPHASERSPTRKLSGPGPACLLRWAGRFGHRRRERSGEKRN